MDLKVGDVVRLKTGGPKMTVNVIIDPPEEGIEVETIWFEQRPTVPGWDGPYTGSFGASSLEKVNP